MYPKLTYALNEMFYNNYGRTRDMWVMPEEQWVWPENAHELEAIASRMTDEDLDTLAEGDGDKIEQLVERYNAERLITFLDEVFDGELTNNFVRLWDVVDEDTQNRIPDQLSPDARCWKSASGKTFVVRDRMHGYIGVSDPDIEPIKHTFDDKEVCRIMLDWIVRGWTDEKYYNTWENLMYTFFPDFMGN